jgi:hypothetical protein
LTLEARSESPPWRGQRGDIRGNWHRVGPPEITSRSLKVEKWVCLVARPRPFENGRV